MRYYSFLTFQLFFIIIFPLAVSVVSRNDSTVDVKEIEVKFIEEINLDERYVAPHACFQSNRTLQKNCIPALNLKRKSLSELKKHRTSGDRIDGKDNGIIRPDWRSWKKDTTMTVSIAMPEVRIRFLFFSFHYLCHVKNSKTFTNLRDMVCIMMLFHPLD